MDLSRERRENVSGNRESGFANSGAPMTPTPANTLARSSALQDEIVRMRRHLHGCAELSFKEIKTSQYVADLLKTFGYDVRTGIAQTGVVGERGAGITVAIRAEMDGLPVPELNRVAYASQQPNVSHACGHDANMACVLGAAKLLACDDSIAGRIRIIMQPAAEDAADEHGKTGTTLMIEQGVLSDVSAIISLHVDSTLAPGKIGVFAGEQKQAVDVFAITVAQIQPAPEGWLSNPIFVAAGLVEKLHQINAEHATEGGDAIFLKSVAGSAESEKGRDPKSATISGTIVRPSREFVRRITDEVREMCQSSSSDSITCSATFEHQSGTSFSPRVAQVLQEVANEIIGEKNVVTMKRKTWMEDFSAFTDVAPGALFLLGTEIAHHRGSHHSPTFDVDESSLHIGTAVLVEAAKRLLTH